MYLLLSGCLSVEMFPDGNWKVQPREVKLPELDPTVMMQQSLFESRSGLTIKTSVSWCEIDPPRERKWFLKTGKQVILCVASSETF